ncbi:MAG: carboxypeptidase regulatory-like domain-containing protein, partial [bacterium]
YNRREAYAIFLGLAKWAAGGVPDAKLIMPNHISRDKQPEIVYRLNDGIVERGGRSDGRLLVYSESASLKIDGQAIPVAINLRKKELRFKPDSALANGPHLVQVNVQNLFKNHNFPRTDTIIIASPVDSISFNIPSEQLPADGAAIMPIALTLFDADGQPAWDGTRVHLSADKGSISPNELTLHNSSCIAYYKSANDTGKVAIVAIADEHREALSIKLVLPGKSWVLSGMVIDDSTKTGIAGAAISIDDSIRAVSDRNGGFFILSPPSGQVEYAVSKDGYAKDERPIAIDTAQSRIMLSKLKANLNGLLHGETIVLDPALGENSTGDRFGGGLTSADANLLLAKALADTLRWAGVKTVLVRQDSNDIPVDDRVTFVNSVPEGWYLKLKYQKANTDSVLVQITSYPGNRTGEAIARVFKQSFEQLSNTRAIILLNTDVREVTRTNKTALEVAITCSKPEFATRDLVALFRGIVAQKKLEKLEEEKDVTEEN